MPTRCLSVLIVVASLCAETPAALIDAGNLTIIDQTDSDSDGLRFLDLTFSYGLTQEDALTSAKATYPAARLASPSEVDDLFVAAGITFFGSESSNPPPSDAWLLGPNRSGLSFASGRADQLLDLVGRNSDGYGGFWTLPDGRVGLDAIEGSTRDFVSFSEDMYRIGQIVDFLPQLVPQAILGWVIVIPEPSSLILLLMPALAMSWSRDNRSKLP